LSEAPAPAARGGPSAASLAEQLLGARDLLVRAAEALPRERWSERPCAAYSPVGWHLGHVAATLSRFALPERERPGLDLQRLFDPFQTPKGAREELPPPAALLAELERAHERALAGLRHGPPLPAPLGLPQSFLWQHLAQHALQHAEHAAVIGALLEERLCRAGQGAQGRVQRGSARVELPGAAALVGSQDDAEAYDNERVPHRIVLRPFWIDAAPATVAAFTAFVAEGGYEEPRLWTEEGWAWRTRASVEAPLGWLRCGGHARFAHPDGAAASALPACGISWFEADAFARWRGARLPTEHEWEHAAGPARYPHGDAPPDASLANVDQARGGLSPAGAHAPSARGLHDLAGNVWEWTSSWFEPYPGFAAYPYDGYSVPWFGGTHRVLRGGSWATAGRLCRRSFRNWYQPGFRELPAGVRCAGSIA
jgi:iron(II)-dependent oxidoreductase